VHARFDAADARRLDALYESADIVEQRRRTRAALATQPGEHVLDVGCGAGHLACELAREAGASGGVTGVDLSGDMLAAARRRAAASGLDDGAVRFVRADAVALPLADDACDAAAATQALEYVDDLAAALAELRRVLRPQGRLAIVDTDWRSCIWHSADRERTERILRAWEGHFRHPHLPAVLPRALVAAGFERPHVEAIPVVNVELADGQFGAGMLPTIAAWVARRGGVEPGEVEAWQDDLRAQADAGTYFFSVCRYLLLTRVG
jgi:arsenite methyltransferase